MLLNGNKNYKRFSANLTKISFHKYNKFMLRIHHDLQAAILSISNQHSLELTVLTVDDRSCRIGFFDGSTDLALKHLNVFNDQNLKH